PNSRRVLNLTARWAMILGIGSDLCLVDRIRVSLKRFGDAYVEHLFSPEERRLCEAVPDPSLLYARCFCGKEACTKALGMGMSEGLGWRDIEVLQIGSVATLRLSDGALDRLTQILPVGLRPVLHVTCSGDR